MSSNAKMAVTTLMGYLNPQLLLRAVSEADVEQYAQAMKDGQEFPPVTVAKTPKELIDKAGGQPVPEFVLVDGAHRVAAADKAGVKHLAVIQKKYGKLDDMLADQLALNRHGARVSDKDRDQRIKMLRNEYGWTEQAIANLVSMSQSSVHRILEGSQVKGRKASTDGETKAAAVFQAKQIVQVCAKISRSLKVKSVLYDLIELCAVPEAGSQEAKDKAKQNRDHVETGLKAIDDFLGELTKG